WSSDVCSSDLSLSSNVEIPNWQKAAGKKKAQQTSNRPPKEIQAENIWKTVMQKIGRWQASRKKRKVDSDLPMIRSYTTSPGCWQKGTIAWRSKPGETNKHRMCGLC